MEITLPGKAVFIIKRDPGDETLYQACLFCFGQTNSFWGGHMICSIFFGSMIASELILKNMDDFEPYQT